MRRDPDVKRDREELNHDSRCSRRDGQRQPPQPELKALMAASQSDLGIILVVTKLS